MTRKAGEIFLILDNIRSAHNVGSIFRTADAAGVSKIYLCGITPTPGNRGRAGRDIAKTALGAENFVSWEKRKLTWQVLEELKKQRIKIVSLEQHRKAKVIYQFKPKFPLALVLGNELQGLSPNILKRTDAIVEIPMRGKKESLNVAVAAGIALFNLRYC
jgi:tRNA G18 (ribose-2'-O)-methylase SpoU